jgi:putative transposase
MSTLEYKISYRRHLPHFQPPGATLFITSRLTDSIPVEVQKQLRAEAERVEAALTRISDPQERAQQAYLEQRRLFGKWDTVLDTPKSGPTWLSESAIVELLIESLHYRDDRVYTLDAFCVMPNHVHIVCTPLRQENGSYHAIAAIMQSLKGRVAYQANLLLGRKGDFWQHENYDHVVRDEAEWIVTYVVNNPVKANLVKQWQDWPWTYCRTNC